MTSLAFSNSYGCLISAGLDKVRSFPSLHDAAVAEPARQQVEAAGAVQRLLFVSISGRSCLEPHKLKSPHLRFARPPLCALRSGSFPQLPSSHHGRRLGRASSLGSEKLPRGPDLRRRQ